MTVEKLFSNLSVCSQPPPVWQKEALEPPVASSMAMAHLRLPPAPRIDIPARNRHQSWSSTGSVSSGKSSPLSISPPLQDLISLQLQGLAFPPVAISASNTRTKPERSLSTSSAETQSHKNVNPTRYKTEMCRPFEENGQCKYGDKCQFAHGRHEVRNLSRHPKYKTELCRTYHTVGFCPYGPRCHFIHNEDELKLTEITQMKHQQMLQQVAQQVAQQQQVLSRMAVSQVPEGPKPVPIVPHVTHGRPNHVLGPKNLDFANLSLPMSSLGSTIDSPPASIADSSSPSMSPTSMLSDDVFSGVPTPPPGFTALPPVMFSFPEISTAIPSLCPRPTVTAAPPTAGLKPESPRSLTPDDDYHGEAAVPSSPVRLPIFSRLAVNN